MKKLSLFLFILGLGCALTQSFLQTRPSPAKKLLFVIHSAGFKHPVLPHAAGVVLRVAPEYGFSPTVSNDVFLVSREGLQHFDAVLFYTAGELPMNEEQKTAFLDFIRSGKGFAGVHSATDTFYQWDEYGKIIGGYCDGHPWNEEVGIRVEDPGHPSTRHLGTTFRIADEIYQFKNFAGDRVHVLMRLDPFATDMTKRGIKGTGTGFPLAWTNQYGQGRIFYTALGHRPEVWDDPRFQEHLFKGLLWTIGSAD